MSGYPDDFNRSAFETRWNDVSQPLGLSAERIGQLETLSGKLEEVLDYMDGTDMLPDLVDHIREARADIPKMIRREQDNARFEQAA